MSAALLTAAAGLTGLLVGWFVGGTQRVNEELIKERRAAYAKALAAADAIAADRSVDTREFEQAVRAADFLSSPQMYKTGRLRALLDRIGSSEWQDQVDWFRELARAETQKNSATRRWLHRRRYRDISAVKRRAGRTEPRVGGNPSFERRTP
jgi:hypothetical protein